MLIYAATFILAAAIAWMIYRYDRFEKEPWFMVLLAIALGFGAMQLAGFAEDHFLDRLGLHESFVKKAALVAGLEDMAKLLVVWLIARTFPSQVNDPMDGIIYGTFAGLGAALNESLLYLSLSPLTLSTLGTELTRLFAHSLMGGVAGFAVGIGARPDRGRIAHPLLVILCLLVSILVHFAWDFTAYHSTRTTLLRAGLMALMLTLMIVWGLLLSIASRSSERIFAPGAGAPGAN